MDSSVATKVRAGCRLKYFQATGDVVQERHSPDYSQGIKQEGPLLRLSV